MRASDITFDGVTRRKGAGGRETVLNRLSLTIAPGACVGLMGKSGSGKTTLLRLLNRLEDPDEGRVNYGGRDIRQLLPTDLRRRVALVTQKPVMFSGRVRDNIVAADTLAGRAEGDAERARRVLALAQLTDDFLDRDASALSVGQQARVQLARALYTNPEVLLLDEATASLDPKIAGIVLDALARVVRDEGRILVHVAHEPDKMRRCDRLLVLAEGRIAQDGPPASILDNPTGAVADVLGEASK
ncbi:MAG: ATP-binding cassette domain-containing protein [Deltaproteobacteria bacterium]|nr:ATP-binding cassette domain-containing protein [Deltaproteobacteria bacterium]